MEKEEVAGGGSILHIANREASVRAANEQWLPQNRCSLVPKPATQFSGQRRSGCFGTKVDSKQSVRKGAARKDTARGIEFHQSLFEIFLNGGWQRETESGLGLLPRGAQMRSGER